MPPLLISTDSYAALHTCSFRHLRLAVEVFDVSFGGRLHIENCTFQDVDMTRSPPKYVSTSLNDDVPCQAPFDDAFKYNDDDDDSYDIRPQPLDFGDPSAGVFVESATLSDCLRPAHECAPSVPSGLRPLHAAVVSMRTHDQILVLDNESVCAKTRGIKRPL